jgi:epoxyqueuosine reductase
MSHNQIQIEEIKAEAANLGFSLFGISKPSALGKKHIYQNWLDNGFQASMGYLSRPDSVAKRFSPKLLVEDCRSVISLGYPYPLINFQEFPGSATSGWISSYAISEDYHTVLIGQAQKLISRIQTLSLGDLAFRAFTDSAPILEREFGVLGNLGWIGKNANLISPTIGSYFLLAEILTDLELEAEEAKAPDRCGKCQRCIDACPTACIQSDRTIDARKCISYLTIENKERVPLELREKIGQWVFGCDICQMVCPWNKVSEKKMEIMENYRISPLARLSEQLSFSEEVFEMHYAGTSVIRPGWMGFTRNLAIVAGNLKDPESLPQVIKLLKTHTSPLIRLHAAWSLGQYQNTTSYAALTKALRSEQDPSVVDAIHLALMQ